jgi:hypothetical protein
MIRQVIQIFVYKAKLVHFYSSAVFRRLCVPVIQISLLEAFN